VGNCKYGGGSIGRKSRRADMKGKIVNLILRILVVRCLIPTYEIQ
jgi:hypothetical protein